MLSLINAAVTLSNLPEKRRARIITLPIELSLASRLMEQGFVPNVEVEVAHKALFNGPIALYLHGTKISIGKAIARQIYVELS